MYKDSKSKIGQLEKLLDTAGNKIPSKIKRHEFQVPQDIMVKQNWDDNQTKPKAVFTPPVEKKKMSLASKILIGSFIFFIITFGVLIYKYFAGDNIVSTNNVDITVTAPISVSGGDEVSFEIEIKNNNNTTLLGPNLGVDFPSGAKDPDNTSFDAKRVQESIGDILPGQSIKKNLSVVLFGGEKEQKDINISLEYKVTGSNSVFNKEKTFTVLINSSPVSIVVTSPKEANTNQNVSFTIDITSNSAAVIKGLLLKVEYPVGFTFVGAVPTSFSKNNLWLVGDLEPKAKRTIKFSGILVGQEGEERGFNFILGPQSQSDTMAISVPLVSNFSAITIRRPFVSADVYLNGQNTAEYVSTAGQKVAVVIKWQNNLSYQVSDVSIVAKVNGNSLDKSSIQVDNGYYRSLDNTITFNKSTDPTFSSLEPGQSGESSFTFNSFGTGSVTGANLSNPIITLDVVVSGLQTTNQTVQSNILFSDSRKIKITAQPQLLSKSLYFIGPFKNTGPLPPKSEQETTYTITWTITNPLNNLSNGQVTAILPPYIKWLGIISPNQERVDYDEGTGRVTWSVGNVQAWSGTAVSAREVSFQISFLPSVNQIGTTPNLMGESSFNAKDNFTLTPVSAGFNNLNTRLSNDPYFQINQDTVVQ